MILAEAAHGLQEANTVLDISVPGLTEVVQRLELLVLPLEDSIEGLHSVVIAGVMASLDFTVVLVSLDTFHAGVIQDIKAREIATSPEIDRFNNVIP